MYKNAKETIRNMFMPKVQAITFVLYMKAFSKEECGGDIGEEII